MKNIIKKQGDNVFFLLIFFVKSASIQACLALIFGFIPAFCIFINYFG